MGFPCDRTTNDDMSYVKHRLGNQLEKVVNGGILHILQVQMFWYVTWPIKTVVMAIQHSWHGFQEAGLGQVPYDALRYLTG
jgi:hypothetical protein